MHARPSVADLGLLALILLMSLSGPLAAQSWQTQVVPGGAAHSGVFMASATEGWVVGSAGVIRHTTDGGETWTPQSASTTANLFAVWGADATHVWASGQGSIFFYNGSTWTSQTLPSGATAQALNNLWGADATHVWAVGAGGTILFWDGTAWTAQASGTTSVLTSVWGSSSSNVWAVGYAGVIRHWNGSAWITHNPVSSATIWSVWVADATHAWAAADSTQMLVWNGTTWTLSTMGPSLTMIDLWGTSASEVWGTDSSGYIVHWNGTGWSRMAFNSGISQMKALSGSGTGQLIAAGLGGKIARVVNPSAPAISTFQDATAISNPDPRVINSYGSPPITPLPQTSYSYPFTISDAEAAASSLSISVFSSNNLVVNPNRNLSVTGSGTTRQLVFTPTTEETGIALITVAVGDGSRSSGEAFTLTVLPGPGDIGIAARDGVRVLPELAHQQSYYFLPAPVGVQRASLFTVFNCGASTLHNVTASIIGPDAASFSFDTTHSYQPVNADLVYKEGLEMHIVCQSAFPGNKYATLRCTSSDVDEPVFDIPLHFSIGHIDLTATAAGTPAWSAFQCNSTGLNLQFTLGYAPTVGSTITVMENTGAQPIISTFLNLPSGGTYQTSYGLEQFAFSTSYTGGTGNDLVFTTTSVSTLPAYALWQSEKFAGQAGDPLISGANADPDQDGQINLIEYTLGQQPLVAGGEVTSCEMQSGAFTLTYPHATDHPGMSVIVEVTTQPTGPWHSGPGYTETVSITPVAPDRELVTTRSLLSVAAYPTQFMRLRFEPTSN